MIYRIGFSIILSNILGYFTYGFSPGYIVGTMIGAVLCETAIKCCKWGK